MSAMVLGAFVAMATWAVWIAVWSLGRHRVAVRS